MSEQVKVLSSAAELWAVNDKKKKLVPVPEWGMSVWVHGLSPSERDELDAWLARGSGDSPEIVGIRAKVASIAVRDEAGKRIFTEDDLPKLEEKSGAALDRVFQVASRFSGMRKADLEAAAKNSASAPSASSSEGSA